MAGLHLVALAGRPSRLRPSGRPSNRRFPTACWCLRCRRPSSRVCWPPPFSAAAGLVPRGRALGVRLLVADAGRVGRLAVLVLLALGRVTRLLVVLLVFALRRGRTGPLARRPGRRPAALLLLGFAARPLLAILGLLGVLAFGCADFCSSRAGPLAAGLLAGLRLGALRASRSAVAPRSPGCG